MSSLDTQLEGHSWADAFMSTKQQDVAQFTED